jgi:hypothetical protein
MTTMLEVKIQMIDEYEVVYAILGPNLTDTGA